MGKEILLAIKYIVKILLVLYGLLWGVVGFFFYFTYAGVSAGMDWAEQFIHGDEYNSTARKSGDDSTL